MTNKENQIRKSCNRFIENYKAMANQAPTRFDLVSYITGYDPKCSIAMANRIIMDLFKEGKLKA